MDLIGFSRTNRVLNDTKPYGNILDFRSQQQQVNIRRLLYFLEVIKNEQEKFGFGPSA